MTVDDLCAIDRCDKDVHCRGWCVAHYRRWKRHGDPLAGRTVEGQPAAWLHAHVLDVPLESFANECIRWPYATDADGYGQVWWEGRHSRVHRVVCRAFFGPPTGSDAVVAHGCGKGHEGCVNPRHLRWASPKENSADRLVHNTHPGGERNGSAKLSKAQALEVIRLSRAGWTRRAVADRFGVCEETVRRIDRRHLWRSLEVDQ